MGNLRIYVSMGSVGHRVLMPGCTFRLQGESLPPSPLPSSVDCNWKTQQYRAASRWQSNSESFPYLCYAEQDEVGGVFSTPVHYTIEPSEMSGLQKNE